MAQAIGPELAERMANLCRAIWQSGSLNYAKEVEHLYSEACAIKVLLPEPVDRDLEEARKIAKPWLIYDNVSSLPQSEPALKAVLAAIKRGRELERAKP